MGVRCCNSAVANTGGVIHSLPGQTCPTQAKTFAEAESFCSALGEGYSLCTQSQVEACFAAVSACNTCSAGSDSCDGGPSFYSQCSQCNMGCPFTRAISRIWTSTDCTANNATAYTTAVGNVHTVTTTECLSQSDGTAYVLSA